MVSSPASLGQVVRELRSDLAATRFVLPAGIAGAAAAVRDDVIEQLDTQVIARLDAMHQPAIVAVIGASGVGKSTLVNTIAGQQISPAGALRPTTVEPILVLSPHDRDAAPSLAAAGHARAVLNAAIPAGIAVLDTPAFDTVTGPPAVLTGGADMWLLVTSATRYGDANYWRLAAQAARRSARVAVVLNRVPPAALRAVRSDILSLMARHDLATAPLFVLPDLGHPGAALPQETVVDLLGWLDMLAGHDRARAMVVTSLWAAVASVRERVGELRTAARAQARALGEISAYLEMWRPQLIDTASRVPCPPAAIGRLEARWRACFADDGPLSALLTGTGSQRRRVVRRGASPVWAQMATDVRIVAAAWTRAAFEACEVGLVAALEDPGAPAGAADLRSDFADEAEIARASAQGADTWLEEVRFDVEEDWPGPAIEALAATLGPGGATITTAAAGLGLQPAAELLVSLVPDDGPRLAGQAASTMARLREGAAWACLEALTGAAPSADEAADRAARLDQRWAELGRELA